MDSNNAIQDLYTNAGCDSLPQLRFFTNDEEAVAAYNGDLAALFHDVMWEHITQGTEIENEYHAIERTRPLTAKENAEANARLLPIRREVVRAGEALRAARTFQSLSTGTVN